MGKIVNDKYYTSQKLAKYCVKKTKEIVGNNNITEWIEPSGGNGVFLDFLPIGTYSCDIEPEDSRIEKMNYLYLELIYKKGRCIIGNPPFGNRNTLSVQFYKKSIELCDYIAFILPISQLDNNMQMYEFDMIYSENLGIKKYSDRYVHCCFNIYKRNPNGYNKKPNYKLSDIDIKEYRRGGKHNIDKFDYAICTWGNSSCGKIPEYMGQYSQEHYFIINNDNVRDELINVIKNTDWANDVAPISCGSKKLQSWRIYRYLKEQIPELK